MECSHYSLVELHLREIPASASKQSIALILAFEAVKRETVAVAFTEEEKAALRKPLERRLKALQTAIQSAELKLEKLSKKMEKNLRKRRFVEIFREKWREVAPTPDPRANELAEIFIDACLIGVRRALLSKNVVEFEQLKLKLELYRFEAEKITALLANQ